MINVGHIYRDQTGTVMNRGENTLFLVLGRSKPAESGESETDSFQVLEIGEEGKPMGPISFQPEKLLEELKYLCNLPKVLWAI